MVEWLMIVSLFTGREGMRVSQLGPFKTEAACLAAQPKIQAVVARGAIVRLACIANDTPKAAPVR